ncbi:MAG TPA: cupin domain-containing protein [Woeseiaceae bacterium]|nr:cupin domain-containing protein [Woeseiaceae bacterium]
MNISKKYVGLAALFVCMVPFAADADDPALPDPLEAGWQGVPVCEKLHEDTDHRILRCTFPPGVGHERHFHPRHFGYAIAGGRVRITDADGTRELSLKTGSSFSSDGVAWHEIENIGDSTIVYLIVEPRQPR